MHTIQTGDIGETRIIHEAVKRGYKVAIPFGHNWKYDLIVERNGKLERVQVKTVNSNGKVFNVHGYSVGGSKGGKKKAVYYKENDFDWFAVYDITTDGCFYLPISVLEGRKTGIYLRLSPPDNNQKNKINWADDYTEW